MGTRGRPKLERTSKVCTICREDKHLDYFTGRNSYCKECHKAYTRSRYRSVKTKGPVPYESAQEAVRRRKYGAGKDHYEKMVLKNNGQCPGCNRKEEEFGGRWCIDHCHQTGNVRGLICHNCNIALGQVRDEIETLLRLAKYLQ